MIDQLIPDIEEDIALPKNASEAWPNLNITEELNMRANVIRFISDISGQPISPNRDNVEEAQQLGREMMQNPQHRPQFANYPNETLALLAGMVAQMNVSIVDDLAELKMYTVNKLIEVVETTKDPKTKVTALRALGEVDGVDAFKKRTEITHKVLTIQEVEAELLETLGSLENKVIDVEAREIVKNDQQPNA
jgi:hypothetical protein